VKRIHVIEREVATQFVDVGARGLSAGDENVVSSDLLDRRGKRVGRADIVCTITGAGTRLGGICNGVLTLRGGQLVGTFAFGASGAASRQAIVGGTGAYAGARGEALVADGPHGTDVIVVELLG
jgi:hypothetical protein